VSSAKKFCPKVSGKGKSRKNGSRNGWRKINEEKYRSGHNEPHSKSYGELSVSSIKNLVAMRVLPGSKIE